MPYPFSVVISRVIRNGAKARDLARRILLELCSDSSTGSMVFNLKKFEDFIEKGLSFYWTRDGNFSTENLGDGSYKISVGAEEIEIDLV